MTASTVLNLPFRQYQRTPTDHPNPEKSNIGFEAADQDVAEEAGGGTNGKGTSRSSIFVSVIETWRITWSVQKEVQQALKQNCTSYGPRLSQTQGTQRSRI